MLTINQVYEIIGDQPGAKELSVAFDFIKEKFMIVVITKYGTININVRAQKINFISKLDIVIRDCISMHSGFIYMDIN